MTDKKSDDYSDGFVTGFLVTLGVMIVALILLSIGSTNGDTFVRDGIRYGSLCEDLGKVCGDWYIIGDAVEFVPTPVVKERS